MRSADSCLQHATAPDRHRVGLRDIMNLFRFSKSADPPDFDVDNAAGTQLDSWQHRAHSVWIHPGRWPFSVRAANVRDSKNHPTRVVAQSLKG